MNLNDLRMSLKAALDNMWARIDARITAIEQGGGGGGVSGVKGNAESTYRTGQVNLTPANIGAVNKTGDTMTGDLTLSANDGTVKLHPYWDSTDGQSLGFYIYSKNGGALNAIFLPLIGDNASAHNIHLLSDLEPVKISQGGTGATTSAVTITNDYSSVLNVINAVKGTRIFPISVQKSGTALYNDMPTTDQTEEWNLLLFGNSGRITALLHLYGTASSSLYLREFFNGSWLSTSWTQLH